MTLEATLVVNDARIAANKARQAEEEAAGNYLLVKDTTSYRGSKTNKRGGY